MAAVDAQVANVYDGLPLIEAATKLKEQGNECVKKKKYNDAVALYEEGVASLDKGDGRPILRSQRHEIVKLRAVLLCNVSQCFLSLELWRRSIDAATACLKVDNDNVKALHRRCQAYEALREWEPALLDATLLQRLGGGGLDAVALQERVSFLRSKKESADRARAAEEESSEDEVDTSLVRLKQRFDGIVEKYDLRETGAADEVADWLVSGEWHINAKRVAQRFKMTDEDAFDFLQWIAKGLEFKVQNAAAHDQMQAQSPVLE